MSPPVLDSNKAIGLITIDGPGGVGKGTLSRALGTELKWHLLESGALYRLVALCSVEQGIDPTEAEALAGAIRTWKVRFKDGRVEYNGVDVSAAIRTSQIEDRASRVSQLQAVRNALLEYQRNCLRAPGLVAEGRDMGTVVFPQATLKIFLTASLECRAERRHLQLKATGKDVRMRDLLADIQMRDERDVGRKISPLVRATDAVLIDSTDMRAEQVCAKVFTLWEEIQNR